MWEGGEAGETQTALTKCNFLSRNDSSDFFFVNTVIPSNQIRLTSICSAWLNVVSILCSFQTTRSILPKCVFSCSWHCKKKDGVFVFLCCSILINVSCKRRVCSLLSFIKSVPEINTNRQTWLKRYLKLFMVRNQFVFFMSLIESRT